MLILVLNSGSSSLKYQLFNTNSERALAKGVADKIGLADSYIDYELCPELLNYDYAERSLHNTLAGHGYVPFRAQRCITARKANEYDAFHLGLKEGAPICYTKTRVTKMF